MNPPEDSTDLAIIGAGPIGLETASLATQAGLDFRLFEKEDIGHHIHQWGHVRLFTPFEMNHSSWSRRLLAMEKSDKELPHRTALLTGEEYRERYLIPLSESLASKGQILQGEEVVEVAKDRLAKHDAIAQAQRLDRDFLIRTRTQDGERTHRARFVVDASGVFSNPLPFGSGNIRLANEDSFRDHITYGIPNLRKDVALASQRLMVVGSGYSAATVLEQADKLNRSGQTVRLQWIYRDPVPNPYVLIPDDPLAYRERLGRRANQLAGSPPDWLSVHSGSVVLALEKSNGEGLLIHLDEQGQDTALEIDHIVAAVGFAPNRDLYRRLQVHECYASMGPIKLAARLIAGSGDCLTQNTNGGIELLRNPEPGFYIVGNKSYGTMNTFLIREGLRQVESVLEDIVRIFDQRRERKS